VEPQTVPLEDPAQIAACVRLEDAVAGLNKLIAGPANLMILFNLKTLINILAIKSSLLVTLLTWL
jgi:hypothetical protein